MNHISMIGAGVVMGALVSYSIAIITELHFSRLSRRVMIFITLGIVLDITATACMIAGSTKGVFTLHGLLGYSALLLMLVNTVLVWRLRIQSGDGAYVHHKMYVYSRIAYIWWVAAFITGGCLWRLSITLCFLVRGSAMLLKKSLE